MGLSKQAVLELPASIATGFPCFLWDFVEAAKIPQVRFCIGKFMGICAHACTGTCTRAHAHTCKQIAQHQLWKMFCATPLKDIHAVFHLCLFLVVLSCVH